MIVTVLGMAAQAAANSIELGDKIQIWLAVITIILVLIVFAYENWGEWYPFKLLGSKAAKYSIAEDPRRRERIILSRSNPEFFLKIAPRIGGECREVSARFQRRASLVDRMKNRIALEPLAHYVSPDVIDVDAFRLITPSNDIVATRAKTTGGKDVFRWDPVVVLTPDEPITCIVVARVGQSGWRGEFSVRLKVTGVTRGRISVPVKTQ